MRNPIAVLKSLTEKSKDKSYKFQRLYRNLYNPEFYCQAHKNIYANKGSMTAGVDGITMDNMSDSRIAKIIDSLKSGGYQQNPARREYIAKKNSKKKRPLGIPSGDDNPVQEIVRMILESIFEQNFSDRSHGFRPHRSCHTALKQIHDTFTGAHWFVEGDIEACFDSFDHHVLIDLLRRRIDDEAFIALIWKFLKAGYMEQWQYHKTYCGTPQGSGISPVLANIYLDELDKFMQAYIDDFETGTHKSRIINPDYNKASKRAAYYKKKGREMWSSLSAEERKTRTKRLRELQGITRSLPYQAAINASCKSIQYVRYADDFLIGVIGSNQDAQKVKLDVKQFLLDKLKLKMSEEKTKVTHTGDRARFLGYDICVSRDQTAVKKKNGDIQRCYSYVVKLLVPREKWVAKLLEYKAIKIVLNEHGRERYRTLHRGKLINRPNIEILSTYNSEIRGLYNFYSLANDSYKIGIFANLMKYSIFKTFANKYKTNVHRIKDRFFKDGRFTVEYQTKAGTKQAVFYSGGFKRKLETMTDKVSFLPQYQKYDRFNSLKNRIKLGICELCGKKSEQVTLHQVKKTKDLTGNSAWEILMLERRRKTLAVCPDCNTKIHQ